VRQDPTPIEQQPAPPPREAIRPRRRKPSAFAERDVTRAVRAVQDAGLQVGMVRIEPDGAILVIPGTPPAVASLEEANEWDE
jgi:hypothetical protein